MNDQDCDQDEELGYGNWAIWRVELEEASDSSSGESEYYAATRNSAVLPDPHAIVALCREVYHVNSVQFVQFVRDPADFVIPVGHSVDGELHIIETDVLTAALDRAQAAMSKWDSLMELVWNMLNAKDEEYAKKALQQVQEIVSSKEVSSAVRGALDANRLAVQVDALRSTIRCLLTIHNKGGIIHLNKMLEEHMWEQLDE